MHSGTINHNGCKKTQSTCCVLLLHSCYWNRFFATQKEAAEKQRLWNSELTIDEWSNSMADGMMSLQQEVEAFGETMPDAKYDREAGKENIDPRG